MLIKIVLKVVSQNVLSTCEINQVPFRTLKTFKIRGHTILLVIKKMLLEKKPWLKFT